MAFIRGGTYLADTEKSPKVKRPTEKRPPEKRPTNHAEKSPPMVFGKAEKRPKMEKRPPPFLGWAEISPKRKKSRNILEKRPPKKNWDILK